MMQEVLSTKIKIYRFEVRIIDLMFLIAVSLIGLLTRISFYPWKSLDYTVHLENWFLAYKNNLLGTLGQPVGDYTAIYNYVLAILSLLGNNSLYLIKSVSVIFDYVGALYFSKIAYKLTNENKNMGYLAYAIFLMLPTVILNSSAWAQCDVIYITFILISFYQMLNNNESLTLFFFSISLSIKLQAIFFLPFLLFLLIKGKIKLRYFLWIPFIYSITIIPMLLFGRSLVSCFETYFIQMGEYNNLVYSAPTIYNFFDINESDLIVRTGLLYSILIIGVICYYFYDRTTLTCANFMLKFSTLFLMIVPFLLPKMHDRYFMLADVFTALCTIPV